jgi:hypothetical protein
MKAAQASAKAMLLVSVMMNISFHLMGRSR